jgi:rod shape-determining protein MreB and related proteins
MGLLNHLGRRGGDLAVDLGTANTVVFVRGEGVVLFEPSVVAIDETTEQVHAVGAEASRMIGRTPATIRATRPLRHGVIADFEITEQMLRHFIGKVIRGWLVRPRVILCVPSGITDVERRAVEEATMSAGAREVCLIEEPMAAAIGADLPVAEPAGNMVVDIGGGTTEVAVVSLGGIVVWQSVRVGGYEMDDAIARHVKREHNLLIGQESAEQLKIDIGWTASSSPDGYGEVGGRDLLSGLLKRVAVSPLEVRDALEGPVARIVDAVKETLEETPPELAADVMVRGIVVVGGGSLLRGFDQRLRDETELPIHTVEEPLTCVALGAGRSLEEFDAIARSAGQRDRGSKAAARTRARRRSRVR